jgi:hypothetical protein
VPPHTQRSNKEAVSRNDVSTTQEGKALPSFTKKPALGKNGYLLSQSQLMKATALKCFVVTDQSRKQVKMTFINESKLGTE